MTDNRGSRRQKIYDLMRTTRDVYIPTLSNTITQLASEATTRAMNYNEPNESLPNTDIQGAKILLYPHLTRISSDRQEYYTQVQGWVYSTVGSVRKKKIIFALARQLAKSGNNTVDIAGQLNEQISSIEQDDSKSLHSTASETTLGPATPVHRVGTASSTSSSASFASTINSNNDTDGALKERLSAFVNRSLGNLELEVILGSENDEELKIQKLLTDANGNFNDDIITEFKPSYVRVSVYLDERLFAFTKAIYPGDSDYAIISDIDDTIKRTGVLDDKRTVFRTTFVDDISTWEVPGAADCYRYFQFKRNFSFFYVSNSPYQLYSTLTDFLKSFEFPVGSIYLKKYTGNILNSMWEPSHTRKKAPLERIITHFDSKKFFLIGDTSEQDLEAYTDITRLYPNKILGIYLRVVDGSMRPETLKVLNDILLKRKRTEEMNNTNDNQATSRDFETPINSASEMPDLIDLEQGSESDFFSETQTQTPITTRAKSAPPKIPKKPESLTMDKFDPLVSNSGSPLNFDTNKSKTGEPSSVVSDDCPIPSPKKSSLKLNGSNTAPPELPKRPIPPLPPRSQISNMALPSSDNNYLQNDSNDEWVSRLLTSLVILKNSGNAKLKFFVDYSEVQVDIESKIINDK